MQNADQTIRIFEKLRKIGVVISIDDFGTGYSSLSYLHRLPFDSLKIDRSFVSTVTNQSENAKILQTIVSLAQNLKLRIVAEGVTKLRSAGKAIILVTHYQRLLNFIIPDMVHVLANGRIVKEGGKELAMELEEKGYDWVKTAAK